MRITAALVVGIWIFVGMLIGVGYAANQNQRYMSPVPVSFFFNEPRVQILSSLIFVRTEYWCWVGAGIPWRIVSEYLWILIALLVSCLLYGPLYLWMRGNLAFHESKWYVWSIQWSLSDANVRSTRQKALVMLM